MERGEALFSERSLLQLGKVSLASKALGWDLGVI